MLGTPVQVSTDPIGYLRDLAEHLSHRTCGFDQIVSLHSVEKLPYHAECTSSNSEWLTHQHRDTLASIVGHPTLTSYLAIADGEAIGRTKFEMTEVRVVYVRLSVRTLINFV